MMRQPKRINSISRRSGDWGSIHIQAYIYMQLTDSSSPSLHGIHPKQGQKCQAAPLEMHSPFHDIFVVVFLLVHVLQQQSRVPILLASQHNSHLHDYFLLLLNRSVHRTLYVWIHCACTVEKVWIPKTHGDLTSMNVRNIPLVISASHSIIWSNSIIGLFINCSTNDVS